MHVAPAARTAISALKGNPFGRATRQAQRLGSTLHPDRRPCAPQELDKLLGKVSPMAKRLKRSETSVVMKIKAIGHSRRVLLRGLLRGNRKNLAKLESKKLA